jgi:hypothetical protein
VWSPAYLKDWSQWLKQKNPDEGVSYEETSDFTHFMQTGQIGTAPQGGSGGYFAVPSHLGIYISPGPSSGAIGNWGGFGYGSVIHSSGFGLSDTAGAISPGTNSPSFTDVTGGGGLVGIFDVSRYFGLGGDQSLTVKGYFDYSSDNLTVGSSATLAPLIVGNGGSINSDTYTFGGGALYRFGTSYVALSGSGAGVAGA